MLRFEFALAGLLGAGLLFSNPTLALDRSYGPFSELLQRHVTEQPVADGGLISWFDYAGALADGVTAALLKRQDALLAEFDPATLTEREPALAFWINAYNYFMIRHILNERPEGQLISSVRDYGSLFDPFRVFGETRFDVGGELYSLRQIELDILLGDEFRDRGWKDARIHFAVNCASVGCPPLRRQLFSAEQLDDMLDDNTRIALDTPLHLKLEHGRLQLTSLFDWYQADFVEERGSVTDFIRRHGSAQAAAAAASATRIEFIDYDWRLNTRENFVPWLQ